MPKVEDQQNVEESRHNYDWQIVLDLQNWRLRLLPTTETEFNTMCAKRLTLTDLDRFGGVPEEGDDDMPNAAEPYLCAKCGLWLDGLCYKHPLVFVKEKTPEARPYTHRATFPEFFYLSDSTIPNAGKGVFTNIPLPEGVSFGPYSGFVATSKKAETSGYSWQIKQIDGTDCWVDAKNPFYSNWMRYVNCARFEGEQNLVALLYNRNIYYYTYKPVAAFEELLVWYGSGYGDYLHIENALAEKGPLAPKKISVSSSSQMLENEEVVINCSIVAEEKQTELPTVK